MATKMIHRYIVNNMKSDEIQYQKLADEPSNVNDETLDEVFELFFFLLNLIQIHKLL